MKLIFLLLLSLLFVGQSSAYDKYFDEDTKTLYIQNAANQTLFTIQQIETGSTICNDNLTCKEEDFNITSYLFNDYGFNTDDLKINWQQFKGTNNITRAEFYLQNNTSYEETVYDYGLVQKNQIIPNISFYQNVTDKWNDQYWNLSIGSNNSFQKWNFSFISGNMSCDNCTAGIDYYQVLQVNPLKLKVFWNETGMIGSHQVTKHRYEWNKIQNLNGKIIQPGKSYTIKIIFYKKPELGMMKLKTTPSFFGVKEEKMSWWNSSWIAKKPIQINNTGSTLNLSYYQIKLNVTYDSDMQNDFDDIRIVNETSGLNQPYWIESKLNGSWINIWINVTFIPNSSWLNNTVYMYYGNPSAASASDGNNTFVLFDDFPNSSVDGTKWDIGGTPTVNNSILTINSTGEYIKSKSAFLNFGVRMRVHAPGGAYQVWGFDDTLDVAPRNANFFYDDGSKANVFSADNISGGTNVAIGSSYRSAYHIYAINWKTSGNQYYIDNSLVDSHSTENPTIALNLLIGVLLVTSNVMYADWVLIRNLAATEPTATTGQEEQSSFAPPIPVIGTVTTYNFGKNISWSADSGNVTDSFNVSRNGTWYNGTTATFLNTTTVPHGWINDTLFAWNSSGMGTLSSGISNNTQIANNLPVQSFIENKNVTAGQWLNFSINTTDADNDTIIYGTNATGTLSGYNYSWLPTESDVGTHYWYFNSRDNYDGVAIENITVTVNPANMVNFTFSQESVSELQIYQYSQASRISVDINDSDGYISSVKVGISLSGVETNYSMSGGNDTWVFDFKSSVSGVYKVTNFYATDNEGGTNSSASSLVFTVVPVHGSTSSGDSTSSPTPTTTPTATSAQQSTVNITTPPIPKEPVGPGILKGVVFVGGILVLLGFRKNGALKKEDYLIIGILSILVIIGLYQISISDAQNVVVEGIFRLPDDISRMMSKTTLNRP